MSNKRKPYRSIRSLVVFGKRYRLRAKTMEKLYGLCEYDRQRLTIDPSQSERDLFDTMMHELYHILEPTRPEEWVTRAAHDMTRFFFDRMKYRRAK